MAARKPSRLPPTPILALRSLIRAGLLVRRIMEPYFAPFGITPVQWGAMHTLYLAAKEGLPDLRLTDLGDRMLVRPPSITGVVDRLERLGLVTRTASADDRRAKHLSLTPAGRRLVDTIRKNNVEQTQSLLGVLTPGEHIQLHDLLERLSAHLESLIDEQEGRAATAKARPSKE
jgi:DNA-binding MarR family transcriptional regulator